MAGPPTTGYRLRKFVRRRRGLVAAIAVILVVLIAGTVISTIFAVGQARARVEADNASADAQLIADFLKNDILGAAGKARVGEATVSYILSAASQSLEDKFRDKPLIEASIRLNLGYTWRDIGESDEAEQHFLRAIDIYKQQYGKEHRTALRIMDYLCYIYEDQGRYRDMESLAAEILRIRQDVYGIERPVGTINPLAVALCHLGKYEEAESWFNKALQSQWPYIKLNRARVYTAKGRYEEAERLIRKAIEAAGLDAEYGVNLRYTTELANVYRAWGQYDKAEPLFDKTLEALREIKGEQHFLTLLCMYGLVRLYVDQDRYEEAEELFGEALPIARQRLREDHPVTLRLVNAYALLHARQKQYDEAEALFDEALRGMQRELGDDHPDTLEMKNDLAVLYKERGFHDKAEPLLFQAVEGRSLKLGETHPHTQESLSCLIDLYKTLNRPEEAEKWRSKLARPDDVDKGN